MVRLKWDNEDSPMYQTGVSQGVFYGDDGVGHAWSGLISVTEKPQNNAPTAVYNAMGEKYDNFGNVAEKKHGLACYVYPEVMDEYLGYEYLGDFGFTVDERPPKKFHMAYRVELGNGLYEIHVLLNQIATFGETARQTVADSLALSTITMNLEGAVDPRIGTSHIRLDSRLPITKSAESLLFGDQYTEANINEFLKAEPVWETVATNYAPIIEPDYDNYVWLGGENLYEVFDESVLYEKLLKNGEHWILNTGVDSLGWYLEGRRVEDSTQISNISVYYGDIYGSGSLSNIPNNTDPLSVSFDVLVDHDCMIEYSGNYINPPEILEANTWYTICRKPTTTVNRPAGISVYRADGASTELLRLRFRNYKIEQGTIHTPWTPAPSDPDQKPRPSDPYPENYKPGVKNIRATGVDVIPHYDELDKCLALYSTSLSVSGNRLSMFMLPRSELLGSTVFLKSEVILDEVLVEPTHSNLGMILATWSVPRPQTDSIPNVRGSYVREGYVDSLSMSTSEYDVLVLFHGGLVDSGIVKFKNIMVSTSESDFFDVNTKPASRGDRYRRVSTISADYTIHQQLRLRSTAKVKLSNITQYDFWLEASDSMLLSQNETFTFNGPQVVIDGGTFTIDDSIQGYAEG